MLLTCNVIAVVYQPWQCVKSVSLHGACVACKHYVAGLDNPTQPQRQHFEMACQLFVFRCIMDTEPREFSAESISLLAQLSNMVMREVERKRAMNAALCNAAVRHKRWGW